jgi:acid phosphatase
MSKSVPPSPLNEDSPAHNDQADTAAGATGRGATGHTQEGRRRFLGGLTAMGLGGVLASGESVAASQARSHGSTPLPAHTVDKLLRERVKHVVVIYAENRSFNNLFADFPGLQSPLSSVPPSAFQQLDRDGVTVLNTLPVVPDGWVPRDQEADGVTYKAGEQYQTALPNAPFPLRGPGGESLPLSIVTHDLWHVFYQNQMQINGGKNNMFVAWADSGAFPMGYYTNTSYSLQLWNLATEFVLCDNFFQGAFGGSFLNHQYLVAATPPRYPNAASRIGKAVIATTVSGEPHDTKLKPLPSTPASAMDGIPKFGPSALTPEEVLADGTRLSYGVNTMLPPYIPTPPQIKLDANGVADMTNPSNASVCPPQQHEHIGDKLDKKGVSWAWYAGAFQQAIDAQGKNITNGTPPIPNFQWHHQPLNYFENLGPSTASRREHLRDGGLGDETSTNHFLADAQAGKLPSVTFYKPQGNLNLHAGYADVSSGDRHIAHIVNVLRNSPQWKDMVILITVDENGGWWDHVAPPKGDRWGPGTRIPALVVSPLAKRGFVDHTQCDTGSFLRLITRTYGLETLDGLKQRDDALRANGLPPMGDMTHALDLAKH